MPVRVGRESGEGCDRFVLVELAGSRSGVPGEDFIDADASVTGDTLCAMCIPGKKIRVVFGVRETGGVSTIRCVTGGLDCREVPAARFDLDTDRPVTVPFPPCPSFDRVAEISAGEVGVGRGGTGGMEDVTLDREEDEAVLELRGLFRDGGEVDPGCSP